MLYVFYFTGTVIYSTVYAINGAGQQSDGVTTDGITVDSTSPLSGSSIQYGPNLLLNSSFESDLCQGWTCEGLANNTETNGETFVILSNSGYVKQVIVTQPGSKYHVSFFARPTSLRNAARNSHLAIDLPSHHQVILVHKSMEHSMNLIWTQHHLYFTATDLTSNIKLSAHGKNSIIELDRLSVELMTCDYSSEAIGQAIHVHVHTWENRSSVVASWMVQDPESPITSYMWALGYVAG